MPTKQSLNGVKERIFIHHMLGASLAGLAVFLLGFVLIPTLRVEASATNLVGIGANWAAISLTLDPDYEATQGGESPSLSTHGNVDFGEITPTAKASGIANSSAGNVGTLEILKKTIRIDTTGNYYQVFLSMNDDNSNALLNTTNSYIAVPAISSDGTNTGTWSSPAYFSSQGWGYAVTGDTEAITLPTFFTASTASINSSLGNELTYANDESVYTGVKFSAVPLLSNPQQIYKNTTNIVGGFSDNNADTFNVYYGVMVNTDVLAGTYNNRIVYTALASAANLDEVSTNVYVEKYIIAKDTEQEISFDLAASTVPSNITTANTHVYLVPHSEMLAAGENGYDIEQLAGYTNPASSYNECEITSLNIADNKSTILCNSPESSNGTADDLANGTNGMFDYWINITGLNFNYVSKTADESETVAYIGLQSTYEEDDGEGGTNTVNYITEMQEMTGSVCKNTNIWNNQIGDDARIMDYSGTTQLVADIMTTDEETGEEVVDGAATSTASAAQGIGTFALVDNRDNKSYSIGRWADGGCWMMNDIALDLASFESTENLTSANTDLNSKSYWDPLIGADENSVPQYALYGTYYYYNWYAATAGSGTADMTNSTIANDSICPFGWQLPTGYDRNVGKSWQGIYREYGALARGAMGQRPLIIRSSGGSYNLDTGEKTDTSHPVEYSSETMSTDARACTLSTWRDSLTFCSGIDKSKGASIRCVARD